VGVIVSLVIERLCISHFENDKTFGFMEYPRLAEAKRFTFSESSFLILL
jgi:hypothetical protein